MSRSEPALTRHFAVLSLSLRRFPFERSNIVVEAARNIIDSEAPRLDEREFSPECCEFVAGCIQKEPADRKLADELLGSQWLAQSGARNYEDSIVNTRRWIRDALPPLADEDVPRPSDGGGGGGGGEVKSSDESKRGEDLLAG